MSWLTVVRMMKVKGGFRSPEDIKKTPLNPEPDPKQLEKNEYVERIRRIHMNDLENLPFFLVAGFLYVFTGPPADKYADYVSLKVKQRPAAASWIYRRIRLNQVNPIKVTKCGDYSF